MDTKNCEVMIYCHYSDLPKVISMLYDSTDGFVEYEFCVSRLDELSIEPSIQELNGQIDSFCGKAGAITDKYQVIHFPPCDIKKVFDLTTALAYTTREDPLFAYVFAYCGQQRIYVLSL